MKSFKWMKVFLLVLILSAFNEVNGLNNEGCNRLREICRDHIDCDYEVLYHSCGRFMRSSVRDQGDPLPPMSLVRVWLFFPEALNPYKEKHVPTNKHDWDQGYHKRNAPEESEESEEYNDAIMQRVRRVLNILEQESSKEKERAEGDQRSPDAEAFEKDENFGKNEKIHRRMLADDYMSNNHKKVDSWDDGVDIRVAKSNENDGDYDIYHLMPQGPAVKYSNNPSSDEAKDGRPRSDVNIETLNSAEKRDSADLNNHNKGHVKNTEKSGADVSAPDFHAKANGDSPSVAVNNKQTPKREGKENVDSSSIKQHFYPAELKDARDLEQDLSADPEKGTLILQFSEKVKPEKLKTVGNSVQKVLWGIDANKQKIITRTTIDPQNNKKVHLRMQVPHTQYTSAFNPTLVANRINTEEPLRKKLSSATGLNLLHAKSLTGAAYKLPKDKDWDEFAVITAIVGGCTLALIVASLIICSIKRRNNSKIPVELHKKEALTDYEELCRTQMALNAASPGTVKAMNADKQRHGLVNGQGKYTKKTWREEPSAYNMDISTGHVILAYMEEHLKDENKLNKEWEALCNYKADQDETTAGEDSKNYNKNRYSNVLPYDHTRVKLRETSNVFHSDYINANFITDSDPRNPSYIATQGPLDTTVPDFWQMIWEQGIVVIVNLTRLSDMGLPQCHRYWPEEGSEVYNTYQVHLISEHIWCDDYIVRSFYLKHLATQETRTITQFHFLTWPDLSVPESAKPLLEFRRKVNKCYRGQACPIAVHCNNGVGRTGTYILIDMVLKKMIKGTKEIDIAATLEYLRDQRPDMVKTKAQFEFSLAAVAEEVTAILSSLSS